MEETQLVFMNSDILRVSQKKLANNMLLKIQQAFHAVLFKTVKIAHPPVIGLIQNKIAGLNKTIQDGLFHNMDTLEELTI